MLKAKLRSLNFYLKFKCTSRGPFKYETSCILARTQNEEDVTAIVKGLFIHAALPLENCGARTTAEKSRN